MITSMAVSRTGGTFLEHPKLELNEVVDEHIVVPTAAALAENRHTTYEFYVRLFLLDGYSTILGPYTLNVGCQTSLLTFQDNFSFRDELIGSVGRDVTYAFLGPVSTPELEWCGIAVSNVVEPAEIQSKFSGSCPSGGRDGRGEACLAFHLADTSKEESFEFTIKSMMPNNIVHISRPISV
jgi:hypothetical protein